MRSAPFLVPIVAALALSACAPDDPVGGASAPIIGGERETGRPYVVAVVRVSSGGAIVGICSGTAITNRHILTAKHCVFNENSDGSYTALPASRFRVLPGDDVTRPTSVHEVDRISTTPGDYSDEQASMGLDIAVLRTATRHGAPARELARAQPRERNRVRIIGFGRTSSTSSASGRKFSGSTRVRDVYRGVFNTRGTARTCNGDSGGPAIDNAGRIVGVTSFGLEEDCTAPESYFTEVAMNVPFVESVIGTAPCTSREETCNGADDDCNGVVDDGCGEIGETCFGDDECISGMCRVVGGDPVCVQECSSASDDPGCPDGYVCEVSGCNTGTCVAGTAGPGALDTPCSADSECETNFCFDPGDGVSVCARQCQEGGEPCGAGRVCITDGFPCGSCVVPAPGDPLPFGSPCAEDGECIGMICRGGACTRSCGEDADCPTGNRCSSGVCVSGAAVPPLGPCVDSLECEDTAPVCADVDGEDICVAECPLGACADGNVCEGGLCIPPGLALGESCMDNAECRSGICAGTCTRICEAPEECPEGFSCNPAGEVSGCFPDTVAMPPPPDDRGGCAVGTGRPSPAAPLALLGVVALLGVRRRR
jgi:MYXO-CTERM domain-containing protein